MLADDEFKDEKYKFSPRNQARLAVKLMETTVPSMLYVVRQIGQDNRDFFEQACKSLKKTRQWTSLPGDDDPKSLFDEYFGLYQKYYADELKRIGGSELGKYTKKEA
ncbi:MAG TPA: hypothetical protein VN132_06540 [Bdellovibrio sp.]|nr:hypothetical protein [Bdellovibrio sp.]